MVETVPDDMTRARAAVHAARAVPGVVDVNRGRYAIARTFGLGGETVEGIQLTEAPEGLHVEVHVAVSLVPILPLADAIRAAVATAVGTPGHPVVAVDVWVDELRVPAPEEEKP